MHSTSHNRIVFKEGRKKGALGTSITKSGLRRMFNAPEGYLWFTADYCISDETWIETNKGRIQMKDIPKYDNLTVNTPEGMKRIYNFRYTGKKQKVRVELNTGEVVICSEDHKFKIIRNGKEIWSPVKYINALTDTIITQEYDNKKPGSPV